MLPISPTAYCQLPIANYYYQLPNFILDSSSLPNKIPHGITWKTPGWDERTPRCAISEGIPQKKSVFQWEILLPVEFPTSCILAVDIPTALKPGFHGKGWNSCCRRCICSWVRDFFPVSLPFLMSSQQMELDFGCGGIQQRESQGPGSRHYGMEG